MLFDQRIHVYIYFARMAMRECEKIGFRDECLIEMKLFEYIKNNYVSEKKDSKPHLNNTIMIRIVNGVVTFIGVVFLAIFFNYSTDIIIR